jgi:VanZ family protein
MPKVIKYWIPVLILSFVIFFFSSRPTPVSAGIDWQDFLLKKTAHIILYSALFVLVYRSLLNTTDMDRRTAAWIAIAYVAIYGTSDEFHQSFTPGRQPAFRDIIIDTAAGGLAWITIWKYIPKWPKTLKTLAENLQII